MAKEVSEIWVQFNVDSGRSEAALKAISADLKRLNVDAKIASKAMGQVDGSFKMAAGDTTEIVTGINNINNQMEKQISLTERLVNSLDKQKRMTKELTKEVSTYGKVADKTLGVDTRGAAQANRFNSANFLAQFQDIAVTSAMGMNPMLIAMQQGTQLQYILAQSNAPLKDFVAGLKSAFSVSGLLTIGLTGLVAALIQMVNWSKVAKTVLNGLGSAFTWLGDKLNLDFLTRMGEYFKELAGKIGLAKTALEEWNNVLFKIDVELESKEFEQSIEGLSLYEKEYQKALRRLQLEFAETKSKLIAKGGNEEDVSLLELRIQELPEEARRIAERNVKIQETAEAKKKEEEALKAAAEAADKDAKAVQRLAEAWQNLQTSSRNKIEDLQLNISLVGAGTYQSTYEKTLADMVRQAESQGINLYGSDNKYEQLQKDAEGIAHLTDEYESLSDKVNFAKSATKGFFSDMRQGLRDGQSAWEAFGNAVSNVLDKILDKIMDIGVDALFSAGYGYGKTSGWWGSETSTMSVPTGKPLMTADGGVFSNGVYTSPTLFKFAKGGKFGIMGEAGPEAVMPLARRSDGSLGVKADGIGGSSPVVVNVINNSNAQAKVEQRQTSQGMEIDVMIDQLVAEKMNQPGTSSNNALRAFNNQKLIAR